LLPKTPPRRVARLPRLAVLVLKLLTPMNFIHDLTKGVFTMNIFKPMMIAVIAMSVSTVAMAGEILGKRDLSAGFSLSSYTLQVQAFDDPKVGGISCHVSDVAVGGLGKILSDDPSNASIACRQTGQIQIPNATKERWWGSLNISKKGEDVFGKTKGWFKKLKVVRFIDIERKVLVYVVFTPKWGKDSNKNVVSSISLYAQTEK